MNTDFDIIIVGGGIAGCALAIGLAKTTDLKVAILEPFVPKFSDITDEIYDQKALAITPKTRKFFQYIGVWQDIIKFRHGEYNKMQVWDHTNLGKVEFDAAKVGKFNLGHIIEQAIIHQAMYNQILANNRIELITTKAEKLHYHQDRVELVVANKTLTAKLLIGADGGNSWVRSNMDAKVRSHDYKQKAIVATIKTEFAHQNIARQVFLSTGPLAFLPLDKPNYCSIVWSNDTVIADNLIEMPDHRFCTELDKAFQLRLGNTELIGDRKYFPLTAKLTDKYIGNRIALIGDAAHVIHPLAGLGANLGFADVSCILDIIKDASSKNKDFGNRIYLRRYERRRRGDNFFTMKLMSLFKYGFGSNNNLITQLRSYMLNICNSSRLATDVTRFMTN